MAMSGSGNPGQWQPQTEAACMNSWTTFDRELLPGGVGATTQADNLFVASYFNGSCKVKTRTEAYETNDPAMPGRSKNVLSQLKHRLPIAKPMNIRV